MSSEEYEHLLEQLKAKGYMPKEDFVFYFSQFKYGHGFQLTQQVLVGGDEKQQSVPCLICEDCHIVQRSVVLSTQRAVREHVLAHYGRGERSANEDPEAYLEDLRVHAIDQWPEE